MTPYTPPTLYTTQQGDMVDRLCHGHYGISAAVTEKVLEANPGLAARGPLLPAGLTISLPAMDPAPITTPTVRLWD